MSYVTTQPQLVAAAAADVAGIRSAISAAHAAAAGPTTGVLAAAADEVSGATATLFSAYGREFQAVNTQAAAFHDAFTQALNTAGSAYANAEAAAAGALGAITAPIQGMLGGGTSVGNAVTAAVNAAGGGTPGAAGADPDITLVVGPSGNPIPSPSYVKTIVENYVQNPLPHNFPTFTVSNAQVVFTPEGLYPITGIKTLTLNVSVQQGLTILNNDLVGQNPPYAGLLSNPSNNIVVSGYSQSSVIAGLEMKALDPTNMPYPIGTNIPTGQLNFSLLADEMNPNGGMLARFPGLTLPSLGITFYGGTPDNSFPTVIWTREYDGFADFPQYPIDIFSDLNAVTGIIFVHPFYLDLTPAQIATAITLPTQGPTTTTYYMIPTENLPLLEPLRAIPLVGNPLADLIQPDMKVLVNWGYGDVNYGWSTGPANVTTPFGVLPPLSDTMAVPGALAVGTQQGINAFVSDISAGGSAMSLASLPNQLASIPLPSLGALAAPSLAASSIDSVIRSIQEANTKIVNAFTNAASSAYATLLPTADIANALVTSIPSYDVNLFLDGVEQIANGDVGGGLLYAFGAPIAADVGLASVAGGVEALVLLSATESIVKDFTGLIS